MTGVCIHQMAEHSGISLCKEEDISKSVTRLTCDQLPRSDMPEQIHESVLDLIGNTPCVRLSRFEKHFGLECELSE